MKGIILAGGSGTRLSPLTKAVCKQLLPIYDKPLIYYPLSTLMFAGIKEILIITTPKDKDSFVDVLGDGSHIGLDIEYKIQEKPRGLADAFIVGKDFIGGDDVCLILGDNIFYGEGLPQFFQNLIKNNCGATILGYQVKDPRRYGVAEVDKKGMVIGLEEKPKEPKSKWAVPGFYVYNNKVIEIAKKIKPSHTGEIEITDVNKEYLNEKKLKLERLGRGVAWFDTGTVESFNAAQNFVEAIETRQGLKIACIEEIAYKMGNITLEQVKVLAEDMSKSQYGEYLKQVIKWEEE